MPRDARTAVSGLPSPAAGSGTDRTSFDRPTGYPAEVCSTVTAPPHLSPDDHLRRPLRAFGRWWAYWALFPLLLTLMPDSPLAFVAWGLISTPLFFWTGLRPMRLWIQRPRPVWLFFVLWMGVPMALFVLVSAGMRLAGLTDVPCCREAR